MDSREDLDIRGTLGAGADEAIRFFDTGVPVKPGESIGGWLVEEEIGRGSMGIVFRGLDPRLKRACAIKVVRPDVAGRDSKLVRSLVREAQLLARLDAHPGIVRVFGVEMLDEGSASCLVMEFLEGGDLADRLRSRRQPTIDEVVGIGRDLIDALAFVHGHGLVHRDLKPSNVLFGFDGRAKIADFGVARDFDANATSTLSFMGALAYAAPEQLAGGRVGPSTDLYALGLVLFDVLCGQPATRTARMRAGEIRRALRFLERRRPVPELERFAGDPQLPLIITALAAMVEESPERRRILPPLQQER